MMTYIDAYSVWVQGGTHLPLPAWKPVSTGQYEGCGNGWLPWLYSLYLASRADRGARPPPFRGPGLPASRGVGDDWFVEAAFAVLAVFARVEVPSSSSPKLWNPCVVQMEGSC